MAHIVEVRLPDGTWVVRTSGNISEEELKYPMRCCGKNKKGMPCHTPMIPVHRNYPYKHIEFRQLNDEVVHILGCPHDKRRDFEISSHLDYRALGDKTEDIWRAMMKNPTNPGNGKGKQTAQKDGDIDGFKTGGDRDSKSRRIVKKTKLPSSPEVFAEVLLSLDINAPYANTYVRNLIIDQRTVDQYRAEGIPEDKYLLVLAKKLTMKNRTFSANKGEIVLVDCKYDFAKEADPIGCMQFRLSLHGKAREHMFEYLKLKGNNSYIVIFSRWKRDPENENTYFAIDADDDHIGRIRLPDDE